MRDADDGDSDKERGASLPEGAEHAEYADYLENPTPSEGDPEAEREAELQPDEEPPKVKKRSRTD